MHDPGLLAAALVGYEQRLAEISGKIAEIQRQLGRPAEHDGNELLPVTEGPPARGRRNMSAAGRTRIAAAQRKRWAAYRKEQVPATAKKAAAVQKAATKPMRRMSAAGRRRIAEAQRRRWAAVRAKKAARR